MKLSENQSAVLAMACTHGHMTQGCATRSDYGARTRTIYSLRRFGLLDVMDQPTELGRAMYAMTTTVHSPNIPFADACAANPRHLGALHAERDEVLAANDEAGSGMMVALQDILDGKDTGAGIANEPWETLRRRVIELVAASAPHWHAGAQVKP